MLGIVCIICIIVCLVGEKGKKLDASYFANEKKYQKDVISGVPYKVRKQRLENGYYKY